MSVFLASLLLFIFGLGSVDYPAFNPQYITSRIEEYILGVEVSQGNPEYSFQGGLDIAQNGPELPEQALDQNNSYNQGGTNSNAGNQENSNQQDTAQVRVFNTSSEKVIANVATVAVENAPLLVSCEDNRSLCDETTSSLPFPTPTPTELPDAVPNPLSTDLPRYIGPPVPSDPDLPRYIGPPVPSTNLPIYIGPPIRL